MGITSNPWRYVVLVIVFIVWIAFSFFAYDFITTEVSSDWWVFTIVLCFVWLGFVAIAYGLLNETKYY